MQTRLRSGIAVAVAVDGSYSSDWSPSLGTSICHRCGHKKTKRQKKRERERAMGGVPTVAKGLRTLLVTMRT